MLIHDSQYLDADYVRSAGNPRKGYGHSTVSMAVRNAAACGVKQLFLFHFDPEYTDATAGRDAGASPAEISKIRIWPRNGKK